MTISAGALTDLSVPQGSAAAPARTTPRKGVSPADAIAHAVRLIERNPRAAEKQAQEVLKYLPRDVRALLVVGSARRRIGDLATAKRILAEVAADQYESFEAQYELGQTLAALGERDAAIASLRRAADLEADFADAWLALSEQLFRAGDNSGANKAYDAHLRLVIKDPDLLAAATASRAGQWFEAREKLLVYLRAHPEDVGAIRLLGETLARLMRFDEAEFILAHCVKLAPDFHAARRQYALVLYDQNKPEEAIAQFETLLERTPSDPLLLTPVAACHVLRMDLDKALPVLKRLIADHPDDAKIWASYGQCLRIAGDRPGAIAALRRAVKTDPKSGDAYWSLADLKIGALGDGDVAAMEAQIADPSVMEEDRISFHYALGKAYEERRAWETSFTHYSQGARHRRRLLPSDPDRNDELVAQLKSAFTREMFAAREGWGYADARPVFVVGLPRSGSTLVEQILGSHPLIEATSELSLLPRAVEALHTGRNAERRFPRTADAYAHADYAREGKAYVEGAAHYRKRGAPLFIDKMPTNFFHAGLIKLMLPNAKIVDIRRDPMGAGFAVFKQFFFRGQNYSYDLKDIGRYYRAYQSIMAHWDEALPGFVHRVHYDELVDDTEGEVRRLLAYLGVEYDEACLNFWRSDRPVATHSSEQVRQPIYRDALDHWRHYEPWLEPLRESFGEALQTWKT